MNLEKIIVNAKRHELLAIASAMLDDQINLIEGIRRISALRHSIGDSDNAVFMPIRAAESETDHFPIGEARLGCSADYLQRVDDEMQRYLADARSDILSACREIIRVFSTTAEEKMT